MINKYIVSLLFLLLTSCVSGVIENQLTEEYWVIALDSKSDASIMVKDGDYMVNVISPTVLSYMVDENFIIVKQRADSMKSNGLLQAYYIIPLENRISNDLSQNVIGPMTLMSAEQKIKMMGYDKEIELKVL